MATIIDSHTWAIQPFVTSGTETTQSIRDLMRDTFSGRIAEEPAKMPTPQEALVITTVDNVKLLVTVNKTFAQGKWTSNLMITPLQGMAQAIQISPDDFTAVINWYNTQITLEEAGKVSPK